jgi:hypothetical protein
VEISESSSGSKTGREVDTHGEDLQAAGLILWATVTINYNLRFGVSRE